MELIFQSDSLVSQSGKQGSAVGSSLYGDKYVPSEAFYSASAAFYSAGALRAEQVLHKAPGIQGYLPWPIVILFNIDPFMFSVIMDLPDPDMTDGQSASQAAPVGSTAPVVGSDTLLQFATLIAQMMSETQSRASTVRSEDMDKHLFEGTVEPRAAEEWLRRLEKTFDGMQCPSDRKVPLAAFLLDGEAEHWWISQQEAKFQGKQNSLITWEEFSEEFRSWFVPPSARQQMQETFLRLVQGSRTVMKRFGSDTLSSGSSGKRRFISGDSRRSGQSGSTTVSGTAATGTTSSGSCFRTTGQYFKCGQQGHQIAECPQAGFDRRSEFRSEGFVRHAYSAGRPRTVPPHPVTEGFSGRSGGSSSAPRRPPTEARDDPDVVTGTIYISDQPYRVLFDSGASHSFLSERCFDALHLDSVLLPISLSVILPAESNLIARKFCFCEIDIAGKKWKSSLILLLISSYDVILGMDWLSLYEAQIDYLKKQKKGCPVFLASVRDMNLDVGSISDIPVVREFADVFPEELVGLPLDLDVEFSIDVFSGTAPISKAPYRMAPKELSELKVQL
ncbi:uncharacterized protein LOC114579490 [Dendrobium catenatum]|uniref:uncharacterized protein LOC114579490 n=1 Tax=Dendrobium catenatum TaxID=906689 RepID=UPI0010A04A64|nr:uncharacterized protein LOC114579490 [Dendrobium catenatum]